MPLEVVDELTVYIKDVKTWVLLLNVTSRLRDYGDLQTRSHAVISAQIVVALYQQRVKGDRTTAPSS
jgi:hypothetical protein